MLLPNLRIYSIPGVCTCRLSRNAQAKVCRTCSSCASLVVCHSSSSDMGVATATASAIIATTAAIIAMAIATAFVALAVEVLILEANTNVNNNPRNAQRHLQSLWPRPPCRSFSKHMPPLPPSLWLPSILFDNVFCHVAPLCSSLERWPIPFFLRG